jgi:hypothetical protein
MARRRGFGKPKAPKIKIEYKPAEEVALLAPRLIDANHSHLAEARICYLFRTGKWESKGKVVFGKAEKVSGKWKNLTGYDFVIIINYEAWSYASDTIRNAGLDHELTHCARGEDDKEGNPKWYIMPHQVEDFSSIIERHGLWNKDLERFFKAGENFKQAGDNPEDCAQVTIFDNENTGDNPEDCAQKTGTEG